MKKTLLQLYKIRTIGIDFERFASFTFHNKNNIDTEKFQQLTDIEIKKLKKHYDTNIKPNLPNSEVDKLTPSEKQFSKLFKEQKSQYSGEDMLLQKESVDRSLSDKEYFNQVNKEIEYYRKHYSVYY